MTVRFCIVGAGRIGTVHGRSIAACEAAELVAISDPDSTAAAALAQRHGAEVRSMEAAAAATDTDAVIICSPTDLHAEHVELFSRAGKAVFCEKPISLAPHRVRQCLDIVKAAGTLLWVGFNRRFDPHFMAVKAAIDEGRIGQPEMGLIISRDPSAPPAEYIRRSGGIFRDMMIHDLDMAVFLLGDLPAFIQASASVLTDAGIATLGDYDSATALLTWADGRQLTISNSRRASYGYDQRIEIHGSTGMVSAENQRPVDIRVARAEGILQPPLHDFFMTRYAAAYSNELAAFIAAVEGRASDLSIGSIPDGRAGLNALLLAEAALEAATTGARISLEKDLGGHSAG